MELTISYILKSVIVLLALYLFYYGILRNQSGFAFNRVYLLLAPLIAITLPLIKWPILVSENAVSEALQAIQLTEVTITAHNPSNKTASEASNIPSYLIVSLVYSAGILLVLLKLINQVWQVQKIKAAAIAAETKPDGVKIYKLPEHMPTFAFGNNIFLGKHEHLNKADQAQILEHELAHVNLHHTWDILYYEILTAILWANPAVWLLKQELRDVHEYQADANVAKTYKLQEYSSLLSKEALLSMGLPVGSYFQKPQILKRLKMLSQGPQEPNRIRQLLVLPFIAALALVFSVQQVDAQTNILEELTKDFKRITSSENTETQNVIQPVTTKEIEQPTEVIAPVIEQEQELPKDVASNSVELVPDKKPKPEATTVTDSPTKERPFVYVEQMPSFKGGETELMKYFAKNIRYPKESQEAGSEGLVVVSFVVGKEGLLSEFEIIKSLDEAIDAEALRVVKSMNGNWEPGMQNGTTVPVRYTLPVRFTLN
jgi:TonB family protein